MSQNNVYPIKDSSSLSYLATENLKSGNEDRKVKRTWFIDVSISNFASRYGRADFSLNGYLDYRMREIRYSDGAFKGIQPVISIRKEIYSKLDVGLSVGYSKTDQTVNLLNHYGSIEPQEEGFTSFTISSRNSNHRQLIFGIPVQYRVIKGLFFELMPSLSFNVSDWKYNPDIEGMHPLAGERYKSVIDNSIYVSKNIFFGRAALGYEYQGLFIKAFYERNLSNVSSTFPFRGEEFTIEYPKWVNFGFTLGMAMRFGAKPLLGYDR